MKDGLLEANEVCALVGCSVYTLNFWYRFKRENPKNEYAKLLPNIVYKHGDRKRYWKNDDMWKLIKFKTTIPHGRYGVLGSVTQRYNKKEKTDGTKKLKTSKK